MSVQCETAAASRVGMRILHFVEIQRGPVLAVPIALWRKLRDGARRRRAEREQGILSDAATGENGGAT